MQVDAARSQQASHRARPAGPWTYGLLAAWFVAVASSFVVLAKYKATPGLAGPGADLWPSASEARTSTARLIMFAHPECPCTRASLAELRRIVQSAGAKLRVEVVFMMPDDAPPSWRKSDIVDSARSIPNTEVRFDEDGSEAKRFGAATSGDVSLYARDGRRLFHGGITASRGHEGDNAGARSILAALESDDAAPTSANVFGCELEGRGGEQ
jgi:hypothetical protein